MHNQPISPANAAVFYPYVHIKDHNWLKATLLVYEHLYRMLPVEGEQAPQVLSDDPPFLHEYTAVKLVRPAKLQSTRVYDAQMELWAKLRVDAQRPEFRERFALSASQTGVKHRRKPFYVRPGKFLEMLVPVLQEAELARPRAGSASGASKPEFVEVHPRIGQALMSTLAVACAQADGLHVVADGRFDSLHHCLVTRDLKGVYGAWLGEGPDREDPPIATAEELFEFIVKFGCDLSSLNAIRLFELGTDRQPMRDLLAALRQKVATIPQQDTGPLRTKCFHDAAADVLREWRANCNNLTGFWKAFCSGARVEVGVKSVEKGLEKVAESVLGGATMGAAGGGAVGASLGAVAAGGALGAGVGLVVGGVVHLATTAVVQNQREKTSAYRVFNALEAKGVTIRASTRR